MACEPSFIDLLTLFSPLSSMDSCLPGGGGGSSSQDCLPSILDLVELVSPLTLSCEIEESSEGESGDSPFTLGVCVATTDPVDYPEPGAASLPLTINPLRFLIENVLRDHAFVLRIKPKDFGDEALGLEYLRILRRIIPPHTALLVVEELTLSEDTIILSEPATEDQPGYTEEFAIGFGNTFTETVLPDLISDSYVLLQHVNGGCL